MYTAFCFAYLAMFAILHPLLIAALDNTMVKTIVASAIVAVVTQLIKRFIGSDSKWVGITTNILASLTAVFLSADHTTLFTYATLVQVVAIFTAAAGIHSTAKSFAGTKSDAPDIGSPNVRAVAITIGLLSLAVVLTGCTRPVTAAAPPPLPIGAVDQVDAKANQTLQAVHAFLGSIANDVQSGKLQLTQAQRTIIDDADRAANVADAAEIAYHNGGGGDASVLNAALASAQKAFTAVQSALGKELQ